MNAESFITKKIIFWLVKTSAFLLFNMSKIPTASYNSDEDNEHSYLCKK